MKLKLFFISIFILLIFVAYQKYSEYSTLKSIDSYESCAAAKGSVIQESYPATCITRLGSRFTQPIAPSTITLDQTKEIQTYTHNEFKFTFDFPMTWEVMTPNQLHNNSVLEINVGPTDIISQGGFILSFTINNLSVSENINKLKQDRNEYSQYLIERGGNRIKLTSEEQIMVRENSAIELVFLDSGNYTKDIIFTKNGLTYQVHYLDLPDDIGRTANQILSTFKFTN